ncbi:MAG: TlpA family protein disulfide reductase, partial [bacterium]|nr:TlpA family protein disulfide reductase [bacterium]
PITRKIILIVGIVAVLLGCQSAKEKELLEKFSREYTVIKKKYDEESKRITTREQFTALRSKRTGAFEELLKKYDKAVSGDGAELLKSKVLMEAGKYGEAEKKAAGLIAKESDVMNEAKLVKVQLLVYGRKPEEALNLFKTIEKDLKPGLDQLSIYLYFALYSPDIQVMEEYAGKFLNAPDIPRELIGYKAGVYRNLSRTALEKKDVPGAKVFLEKGIAAAEDEQVKAELQEELVQLELIGSPAPPIAAETWVNSRPLDLARLKGNVVVIDFWATWCNPCRMVIPGLIKLYDEYKDKGLVIIGLTKLYGRYSDDTGNRGTVDKAKEISLVKEFVQRHKITYPVAIASEGVNGEKYKIKAIPTMVFINRKGDVASIKVGAGGDEKALEDAIKKLLEEK